MSLVLQSSGGGQVTIQEPTTASNFTQTLPAATGDVMVSGNMPAFSAYSNNSQSIASSTFTKVQYNVETFDTANAFDSTTNYRFTPQVAGYYQITLNAAFNTITGAIEPAIYKNGTVYAYGPYPINATGTSAWSNMSALIYLNGSTDYVEGYIYQTSGISATLQSSNYANIFAGVLVRAA
jgi:hypothetical protein